MENFECDIKAIVEQGGPEPDQYMELNGWFRSIGMKLRKGEIERGNIKEIMKSFGEAFSRQTMQGFVVKKPHGYAGDFEIIDKIYMEDVSRLENLKKWDFFFHWQKASQAVRNRKEHFKSILCTIERSNIEFPQILNVGSGPCRDIYEYILENPNTNIRFECLDMDKKAIEYSKNMLKGKEVLFYNENIFNFKTDKRYELVWSSGLFDYLDDKRFIFILRTLYNLLSPCGRLIVGNFSTSNPSRDYMEFGEWYLFHRNEDDLVDLAKEAGIGDECISVESEESGVNLFLITENR